MDLRYALSAFGYDVKESARRFTKIAEITEKLLLKTDISGEVQALLGELLETQNEQISAYMNYRNNIVQYLRNVEPQNPIEQAGILKSSVRELNLSTRARTCLRNANINTVEELLRVPERELIKIKNFGMKSLNEIKKSLEIFDLHLK